MRTVTRWLLRALGGAAIVILVGLAAWSVAWGPDTVWNVLYHRDTAIDDWRDFPGRPLKAASQPAPFAEREARLEMPSSIAGGGSLDAFLEGADSVALVVLHGDVIVYERYFDGFSADDRSQIFSISKSILSILVGAAIDDGHIDSVDQPVTAFVPELADTGFEEVTIEHLLDMRSGMDYVEEDIPWGRHAAFNYTPRLEEAILDLGVTGEPGAAWNYKSGDTALLGLILDRALGARTITDYLQERLWEPLGMEHDATFSTDHPGGLERTWCCLATTARDLAKLGRLYLDGGAWNGAQIISRDWIQGSVGPSAIGKPISDDYLTAAGLDGYHHHWWLVSAERESFLAQGKGAQMLYVDPSTDTVIVRLGWTQGEIGLARWLALFTSLSDQLVR